MPVGDDHSSEDQAATPDPWVGQVIDGRYRILERVGQGGMGVVYRVEHTRIGKIAAMKLLHANLVSDRDLLRRFHAEAEAISKLAHPNIVQVFDFGRANETAYLVMEYLAGEDLGAILRRDGVLQLSRCTAIVAQICDALAEAHEIGIVHRDLKPENIRVSRTKDGRDFVKVLDFGLAKMIESDKQASITAQGSLVGTPYYMAPEQIRAGAVDHRCDIYGLGAMLYHMLTGHHAFAARTPMGVLTRHITEDLVPPSRAAPRLGITAEVDALVTTAMAKDPARRYATALDLKQALVALATQQVSSDELSLLSLSSEFPLPGVGRRSSDQEESRREEPRRARLVEGTADEGGATWSPPDDQVASTDLGLMPTGQMASPPPPRGRAQSREEVAFERRLRRGRLLRIAAVVLLVSSGGLAASWFCLRGTPLVAPAEEIEPNNEPQQATPLAPGRPVLGHLGRRVSATESDRDYFLVRVTGSGVHVLRAEVTGIPNMDITLELYDAMGGLLTTADDTGVGGAEVITNWPVSPGKYFLLVREMWRVGARPTENVTDSYRLEARWPAQEPGWEREPNDRLRQANDLPVGTTVRGYLGGLKDRDCFRIAVGEKVRVAVEVSGAGDTALVLETWIGRTQQRASHGRSLAGVVVSPDEPVIICLQRERRDKLDGGRAPPGLKSPYQLRLSRE